MPQRCRFNIGRGVDPLLKRLQQSFKLYLIAVRDESQPEQGERAFQLAAATLLVEMCRADFAVQASEVGAVRHALERAFALDPATLDALITDAEQEADAAVSLHGYTNLINQHFDPKQKYHLVELLWTVAFADGQVDRYEEHFVRKVADLIYVPHREFIRAKLQASPE